MSCIYAVGIGHTGMNAALKRGALVKYVLIIKKIDGYDPARLDAFDFLQCISHFHGCKADVF
jgi:hypothetical protein